VIRRPQKPQKLGSVHAVSTLCATAMKSNTASAEPVTVLRFGKLMDGRGAVINDLR
jgi:hypothetical protein